MDITASERINIGNAISRKLAELGAGPDDVAAALTEKGCKGSIGNSMACPVSMYLKSLGWDDAFVGAFDASIYDEQTGQAVALASLPVQIQQFIRRFDGGLYPDLIHEGK